MAEPQGPKGPQPGRVERVQEQSTRETIRATLETRVVVQNVDLVTRQHTGATIGLDHLTAPLPLQNSGATIDFAQQVAQAQSQGQAPTQSQPQGQAQPTTPTSTKR